MNAGFRFSVGSCARRQRRPLRHRDAVPPQVAGVESLVIATPPAQVAEEGLPNKTISPPGGGGASPVKRTRYTAVGGAQAIAMFSYMLALQTSCAIRLPRSRPGGDSATAKSLVSASGIGRGLPVSPKFRIIADETKQPEPAGCRPHIGQAELDELPVPCCSPTPPRLGRMRSET